MSQLTSVRGEALRLYRQILRTATIFRKDPPPKGSPFRTMEEALKTSARTEFEQNRFVSDPETVARLLVMGNDSLMEIQTKIAQKVADMREKKGIPSDQSGPRDPTTFRRN